MTYQAPEDRWRDETRAKSLGLWSPPKPEPIAVEAVAQFTDWRIDREPLMRDWSGQVLAMTPWEGVFTFRAYGEMALRLSKHLQDNPYGTKIRVEFEP
jgi:hypothetical protein